MSGLHLPLGARTTQLQSLERTCLPGGTEQACLESRPGSTSSSPKGLPQLSERREAGEGGWSASSLSNVGPNILCSGVTLTAVLSMRQARPTWLNSHSSHRIKHKNNETAVLGEDVTIFCNLTTPADVVQITWQKIQDSLPQNIGTYSDKYGEKILPPYVDRLHCKIIKPNISFLTIREVAFEDEACYKCLFNVFPHGSQGGQICLTILTISELRNELQFNPDSEGLLSLSYSAVGKPAPQISLFPSQVLMKPPEEYLAQNPNSTVTVTKTYTISLETVKSLGLQHLIVHVDHPLRKADKIVPLYVKEECK
ncbi:nectin-1-like [Cynocephalus volans]|uniref:nectin-1-like n=1 Tax=Cynocephalus volans TaxID=110931 RepID=UPI002FC85C6A